MKTLIYSYIEQFNLLHDGEPWLDENFTDKLGEVTEAEVFTQPHGLLSIAEEIWHLIAWREVVIKRLSGEVIPFDEVPNWRPLEMLKDMGWRDLATKFQDSHDSLIQFLSDKEDSFLKGTYSDTGLSFKYYLDGLVHHDAYHLGQIGIVIKLLRRLREL